MAGIYKKYHKKGITVSNFLKKPRILISDSAAAHLIG
jgi:hypothetical protein